MLLYTVFSPASGFTEGILQDVGEGGSMLSGGQCARVALARAVYARAEVTVLDDPLCSLDPRLGERVSNSGVIRSGSSLSKRMNARCLTKQLAVLLLDARAMPMSQVFVDCVAKGGLLRGPGRSVLLVTNKPTQLARCDMVLVLKVYVYGRKYSNQSLPLITVLILV